MAVHLYELSMLNLVPLRLFLCIWISYRSSFFCCSSIGSRIRKSVQINILVFSVNFIETWTCLKTLVSVRERLIWSAELFGDPDDTFVQPTRLSQVAKYIVHVALLATSPSFKRTKRTVTVAIRISRVITTVTHVLNFFFQPHGWVVYPNVTISLVFSPPVIAWLPPTSDMRLTLEWLVWLCWHFADLFCCYKYQLVL